MPANRPVNLIRLPADALGWAVLEAALPPVSLTPDGHLADEALAAYRRALSTTPALDPLRQAICRDLPHYLDARGYLIVELPDWDQEDRRLATAVLALVGRPLKTVGHSRSLWEELGVNLDAEAFRFAGTGFNPPHIDYVNASHPPDYTCLLSIRTDPSGGGASIVANLQHPAARLTAEQPELAARLRQSAFHEGRFYDLTGIGRALPRFAVITDDGPGGIPWIRFTGKILLGDDAPHGLDRTALEALQAILLDTSERFVLNPRQLLIVNNLRMAHGREPLGNRQADLAPERRRLLYQTHIRLEAHPAWLARPHPPLARHADRRRHRWPYHARPRGRRDPPQTARRPRPTTP